MDRWFLTSQRWMYIAPNNLQGAGAAKRISLVLQSNKHAAQPHLPWKEVLLCKEVGKCVWGMAGARARWLAKLESD